MSELNNLEWQWLDELLKSLTSLRGLTTEESHRLQKVALYEAKAAITTKINEIEKQAQLDEIDNLLQRVTPPKGTIGIISGSMVRDYLRKRKDEVLK